MIVYFRLNRITVLTSFLCVTRLLTGEESTGDRPTGISETVSEERLPLTEYMQRVVDFNDSIQGRAIGFQAARYLRKAETGTFEPSFVSSVEFVDRDQPNNFQIERSLGLLTGQDDGGYPSILLERNWSYSSAIEMATPLGTRFRLGATAREIRNNVPRPSEFINVAEEVETSVGFSVEQPVLKGLGYSANLASLRLAARQSEIAFQEYRREMIQVVAAAEMAYWDTYYAQIAYELNFESVELAKTLVADNQASFDAGRGSQLDVLEAEAGLAQREAFLKDAYLKRVESQNNLAAFFGGRPKEEGVQYVVTDAPISKPVEISFRSSLLTAQSMNPDLLSVRLQIAQELIRLGYAKNQKLPELNLTASYGSTGLGFDWETSFQDVEKHQFPTWTVGLMFRLPMWGNVRGKNQLRATRLRLMQIGRAEANLLNQIHVGTDTAEQRVESNFTTARSLEAAVEFRTNLLNTRMESRDVGRMDTRSVLEAEQDLFITRLEQLKSETEYQRALLELQMLSGSLLQMRNLEMSMGDLEERTQDWLVADSDANRGMKYQKSDVSFLPLGDPFEFYQGEDVIPWFGLDRRSGTSKSK